MSPGHFHELWSTAADFFRSLSLSIWQRKILSSSNVRKTICVERQHSLQHLLCHSTLSTHKLFYKQIRWAIWFGWVGPYKQCASTRSASTISIRATLNMVQPNVSSPCSHGRLFMAPYPEGELQSQHIPRPALSHSCWCHMHQHTESKLVIRFNPLLARLETTYVLQARSATDVDLPIWSAVMLCRWRPSGCTLNDSSRVRLFIGAMYFVKFPYFMQLCSFWSSSSIRKSCLITGLQTHLSGSKRKIWAALVPGTTNLHMNMTLNAQALRTTPTIHPSKIAYTQHSTLCHCSASWRLAA